MKTFVITFLTLAAFSSHVLSQETMEHAFPLKRGQTISLNLKFASDIKVVSWSKESLLLKAEIDINHGELNKAHKIESNNSGNRLEITTDFDQEVLRSDDYSDCHDKNNSSSSHYNFNDSKDGREYSICSRINYTVFVPSGADLKIETISGNIQLKGFEGPLEAKSISGLVEMTGMVDPKADVFLKSVMGKVFSDLGLARSESGLNGLLVRELSGKLNGGGRTIHLESVTGDVILNKAK